MTHHFGYVIINTLLLTRQQNGKMYGRINNYIFHEVGNLHCYNCDVHAVLGYHRSKAMLLLF